MTNHRDTEKTKRRVFKNIFLLSSLCLCVSVVNPPELPMIPKLIQRRGAAPRGGRGAHRPPTTPALNPPPDVLELVPESVARENNILPLRLDGRVLHVATANASDILLRDKLRSS